MVKMVQVCQTGKRERNRIDRVNSVNNIKDSRPYLSVKCGKLTSLALIDTGAVCFFIDLKTAQEIIATGGQCLEVNMVASMADNTEVFLKNKIQSVLNLNGSEALIDFFIMNGLTNSMLLGMEFLQKVKAKFLINNMNFLENIIKCELKVCFVSTTGLNNFLKVEEEKLNKFLNKHKTLFSNIKRCTPLLTHEIRLEVTAPLKQRYQQRNPYVQDIMNKEVG